MLAVMGVRPVFVAGKDMIFPVPLAERPMAVLSLDQVKLVPATVPEKGATAAALPLQNTWLAGWVTVGVGFTVIGNVFTGPGQFNPADK